MDIELPKKVKRIISVIQEAGYEAYAVGGCVRDSILGRQPDDWDIAISFSKPQSDNLIVSYKRKVNCGFFASIDYLNNYGIPDNLSDIKKNHIIYRVYLL